MAITDNTLRAEIERVVRAVLAEMLADGRLRALLGIASEPANNQLATSELVIQERVVSLSLLTGRLNGITRLVVPRGAIVTPAVRDELKQRQIAIASAVPERK